MYTTVNSIFHILIRFNCNWINEGLVYPEMCVENVMRTLKALSQASPSPGLDLIL
jgi:hypothetical protein